MKLYVEIDLDTEAFGEFGAMEVERLLQSVASRVPDPLTATQGRYSLHDANEKYVGHFEITGESECMDDEDGEDDEEEYDSATRAIAAADGMADYWRD